tara:strand:- start:1452 stop:1571 length:120 start_codon:yes stop_codon:yes gene_type:complete
LVTEPLELAIGLAVADIPPTSDAIAAVGDTSDNTNVLIV